MKSLFLITLYLCIIIGIGITEETNTNSENDETVQQFSVSSDGSATEIKSTAKEQKPTRHPAAMGIVMKNPRPYPIKYYWWSNSDRGGVYQGPIGPRSVASTNSYVGHVFYFTKMDKETSSEQEFYRITVVSDINQYILPPEEGMENDPHYVSLMQEFQFVSDYRERTGRPWLAHYPREPPIHHMWPADHIGQIHTVTTPETFWDCVPDTMNPTSEEIENCRKTDETVDITLEVISLEPRAYKIANTLSAAECDLIIELAKPKVKRSRAGQAGGLETTTRTSKNAWLGRKAHYVLDTIYRRTADIVNISSELLQPGTKTNIVEDMQVVYYEIGEEYTPHHDFGADGRAAQRYITLLFYLTDQNTEDSGGETNFPKANNGNGMAMHPGKGSSVMFYSLLEDGNADDKSLHAALPVKEGIKWLANFWIWDPKR